ncbi:MAG: uroporphyrinogen-III synthase [Ardenticatenaceae bacterium]|nr:uroporphyrinogen-III synthase [Ardenticatenaceae bacterium]
MAKPLDGKRIVVTRSPDLAEPMCKQLAAWGAVPLRFPVIDFVPLPAPELDLAHFDWLVFTSGNGVRFFFERLETGDWRLGTDLRVAAVGEATGRLLAEYGVDVAFVPEVFTGEALGLGLGDVRGKRILLPRAKIGRPEIVDLLRERGAVVDDVALYETVTAVADPAALAELDKGVDVLTFTSPSSVRNFLKIVPSPGSSRREGNPLVACIGPSTAEEAEKNGLTVSIVPDIYTIEGLITAVVDYFESRTGVEALAGTVLAKASTPIR